MSINVIIQYRMYSDYSVDSFHITVVLNIIGVLVNSCSEIVITDCTNIR